MRIRFPLFYWAKFILIQILITGANGFINALDNNSTLLSSGDLETLVIASSKISSKRLNPNNPETVWFFDLVLGSIAIWSIQMALILWRVLFGIGSWVFINI